MHKQFARNFSSPAQKDMRNNLHVPPTDHQIPQQIFSGNHAGVKYNQQQLNFAKHKGNKYDQFDDN